MKVGQIILITANNAKGRIDKINKNSGWISISWQRSNSKGELYYNPTADRYDYPHIERLLKQGTLSVYSDLSIEDPNLLFDKYKGGV